MAAAAAAAAPAASRCGRVRLRRSLRAALSVRALTLAAAGCLACLLSCWALVLSPPVRGLRVACVNMWANPSDVLVELHVLRALAAGAGAGALWPLTMALPQVVAEELADVLLVGVYGVPQHAFAAAARARARGAVTIFIASECTAGGELAGQMAGAVDVSLGHRRALDGGARADYLRMPWWLPYGLDAASPRLAFPAGWSAARAPPAAAAAAAAAWAARPGYAALLASHASFPRPELFAALAGVAADLGGARTVDAPGAAFHNMPWPPELHNSHLTGKVAFLRRYRFNIAPENKRCDGGYNTEKLVHAHIAGAVPVYWGDTPIDELVFNGARVLTLDERAAPPASVGDIAAAVARLETNATAREAFFAEPILAPTAQAWLDAWAAAATKMLRDALDKPAARARRAARVGLGGALLADARALCGLLWRATTPN